MTVLMTTVGKMPQNREQVVNSIVSSSRFENDVSRNISTILLAKNQVSSLGIPGNNPLNASALRLLN